MKDLLKFLVVTSLFYTCAFAAEESHTFLKKCFQKQYETGKSVKQVTFAIYEDLTGDTFGALQVHLKNPKGPTAGVTTTECTGENGKFTCIKDGGKLTIVDEGPTGILKVEEPLQLKTENQFFPGKVSVTRLPASTGLKLEAAIPSACEKLVP